MRGSGGTTWDRSMVEWDGMVVWTGWEGNVTLRKIIMGVSQVGRVKWW